MFLSGVSSSVLLCRFLVLLMDDIVMLMVWFGCIKVGSVVVIIMVVVFFSWMFVLVGILMLNCVSMLLKFWIVNGVCVVWLLLLLRFMIRL